MNESKTRIALPVQRNSSDMQKKDKSICSLIEKSEFSEGEAETGLISLLLDKWKKAPEVAGE